MALSSYKRVRYSTEKLDLLCEWENCVIVQDDMDIFLQHIINEHLTRLDPGDLHCHWKDCEGFTDNLSEFRRHILLHAFHSKIKCYGANLQIRRNLPNCSASIHSRNIVPELPEPLLCCWEECMTEYECPEYLYRHVDLHAEYDSVVNGTTICLWQDCNRTFADRNKVRDHLRSHTQEKLVACPTCGGMFASRTKFFEHIQRQQSFVDGKTDCYACEYCPKKMVSERLLRDHMRHHVNHYKCPYCDMTCPTPSALSGHVAYRHSKDKPHSCQYCDYRSKTESDLRKHLESHAMAPTYQCLVTNCTYASRSQTCYRAHYRKVHEGKNPMKYSCHLCEKIFSRGNYLTKHLLNHHKFRWPSGHCRFRYCLNEEGVYQLQTVRYESIELSQEMMGENSEMVLENGEDVDNPDSVENFSKNSDMNKNGGSHDTNIPNSHIPQNIQIPNSSVILSGSMISEVTNIPNSSAVLSTSQIPQIANLPDDAVVLNVQKGKSINNPEALPVVYVPYVSFPGGQTISEEPVLIKILDPDDCMSSSFSEQTSIILQSDKAPDQIENFSEDAAMIKSDDYDNINHIQVGQGSNSAVLFSKSHTPQNTQANDFSLMSSVKQVSDSGSTPSDSAVFSAQDCNPRLFPAVNMPYVVFPDGQTISDEPVLIKILEANDCAESSHLNQTSTKGYAISQPSTVQCITTDATGSLVFDTVQITEKS